MVQTPLDGGMFFYCSVKHTSGFNYSAEYIYSDVALRPTAVFSSQIWMVRWRYGFPILIPAIAFAAVHDGIISETIKTLHTEMTQIEDELAAIPGGERPPLDLAQLTQRLQALSSSFHDATRRLRFQTSILHTVSKTLKTLVSGGGARADLEIENALLNPLYAGLENREFDFETLPHREQTARQTVSPPGLVKSIAMSSSY